MQAIIRPRPITCSKTVNIVKARIKIKPTEETVNVVSKRGKNKSVPLHGTVIQYGQLQRQIESIIGLRGRPRNP